LFQKRAWEESEEHDKLTSNRKRQISQLLKLLTNVLRIVLDESPMPVHLDRTFDTQIDQPLVAHKSMFSDNHQDIPKLFYSAYSDEPFDKCVDCHRELTDEVIYVVQKHFVADETVFEMAICFECNQDLNKRLSEESKNAIQQFLEERSSEVQRKLPEAERSDDKEEDVDNDFDSWFDSIEPVPEATEFLNACAYCGMERDSCHRHAISGVFQGGSVIVHDMAEFNLHWPMLICEKCVEATNDLISEKTRDEWNRFVEHHFDGPPGLEVDWPTQQPVFM
jgi:hypothetical protein